MNLCVSCKNANSTDRCDRLCLTGLNVCGLHARAKSHRNWYRIHNIEPRLVKIQALWKGYSLRNRLKQAGTGVLKRSLCHNEEDFVSLDPIAKLDPRAYFSFEEDGKLWAFNVYGLARILLHDTQPKNPYTRTPLSHETRRRLRKYFFYLVRHRDPDIFKVYRPEIIECKLNLITQTLHENGFEEFRPEYLYTCTNDQAYVIRAILLHDMRAFAFKNPNLRIYRYCSLLNSRTFMPYSNPVVTLIHILSLILANTCSASEEYEICFLLMSALFKV
jgi:hypothetical protein